VSIYLACRSYPDPCATGKKTKNRGSFTLSGEAAVSITAPADGRLQSIALFFDRRNRGSLALTGTSRASVSGAVYGQVAGVRLSGSSQIVLDDGPLAIATLTRKGQSWLRVGGGGS